MRRTCLTALFALLAALVPGSLAAAEKGKLMHCFYFTTVENASEADWNAFYAATDQLPSQIPGLLGVWHGKLSRPQTLLSTDAETRKKLAAGEKSVSGPVSSAVRQYGVCMAMADQAALKAYADSAAHKAWVEKYSKVRVEGTSTFDIVGR
jgi:hypothetical protein